MQQQIWESILRTAVTGLERTPLPASLPSSLGLRPADNPEQTALDLLAAAVFLQKAGKKLRVRSLGHEPPREEYSSTHPEPRIPNFDPSLILSGRYAALQDEWLALLAKYNLQIAPEYLPELLDRAAREPAFWEKLRPMAGTRGAWLAAQNPLWEHLYEVPATDWWTADFKTRLQLLQEARRHRPLVALAWLEKTWAEESEAHKAHFLETLHIGLSGFDEAFLERVYTSKSKHLRYSAALLLAMLPDSQQFEAWGGMAHELADFVIADDLAAFLAEKIPDIEASSAAALFALGDGKDFRSARLSILRALISLLPPVIWESGSQLTPISFIDALANLPQDFSLLSPLLLATTRHRDERWAEAWIRWLGERPNHPYWKSGNLLLLPLLNSLSEDQWNALMPPLCRHHDLLSDGDSVLWKALVHSVRPWGPSLLRAFLAAWRLCSQKPFAYQSPPLKAVLEHAALCCHPEDAEAARQQFLSEPALTSPWQQALDAFFDTTRWRQKMANSLAADARHSMLP